MIERTASCFTVHRPRPFDLLLRTSEVELGGILDQQGELDQFDSPVCGFDVRFENLFGSYFVVVEKR